MEQISRHIYIYPYEERRDRPTLGYIAGSRFAAAIDSGHSADHIRGFYADLEKRGLPLPEVTVLTHWHWDHTFAMHAVHGLTAAERRTDEHLRKIASEMSADLQGKMMQMDGHIRLEYQNQRMKVVPADLVFEDHMQLFPGDIHVHLIHVPSPHTDDCTVIWVPEEKALFVGDAPSGAYPDYVVTDLPGQKALREALEKLDFDICIGGHWPVQSREEFFDTFFAGDCSEERHPGAGG